MSIQKNTDRIVQRVTDWFAPDSAIFFPWNTIEPPISGSSASNLPCNLSLLQKQPQILNKNQAQPFYMNDQGHDIMYSNAHQFRPRPNKISKLSQVSAGASRAKVSTMLISAPDDHALEELKKPGYKFPKVTQEKLQPQSGTSTTVGVAIDHKSSNNRYKRW